MNAPCICCANRTNDCHNSCIRYKTYRYCMNKMAEKKKEHDETEDFLYSVRAEIIKRAAKRKGVCRKHG